MAGNRKKNAKSGKKKGGPAGVKKAAQGSTSKKAAGSATSRGRGTTAKAPSAGATGTRRSKRLRGQNPDGIDVEDADDDADGEARASASGSRAGGPPSKKRKVGPQADEADEADEGDEAEGADGVAGADGADEAAGTGRMEEEDEARLEDGADEVLDDATSEAQIEGGGDGSRVDRQEGPSKPAMEARTDDVTDGDDEVAPPDADADLIEYEQSHWEALTTLATSESNRRCTFQGDDARLTVSLKVHTDPDSSCRLGYYARFILRHRRGKHDRSDDEGDDVVGSIQSWRIAKNTHRSPNAEHTAWLEELLAFKRQKHAKTETAKCLRVLFNGDGEVTKEARDHADALDQKSLMFIEMIHIRPAFARNGLLRHALESWYEALERLPEWFAFSGTLVLVPSKPDGAYGDAWIGMSDEEIEASLINVYRRRGFERWAEGELRRGLFMEVIIVMGRATPGEIAAEESPDGEGPGDEDR